MDESWQEAYADLLDDLRNNVLTVGYYPSKRREEAERGAKIRVVEVQNPKWYRDLCAKFLSGRQRKKRKIDTAVRRQNILRVLARLAAGKPSKSKYVVELQHHAEAVRVPF